VEFRKERKKEKTEIGKLKLKIKKKPTQRFAVKNFNSF
jgi:hypothetical protein